MKLSCVLLLALLGAALAHETYEGYHILRTKPVPVQRMGQIKSLMRDTRLNFLTQPRVDRPLNIMMAPEWVDDLMMLLGDFKLEPQIVVSNVEEMVKKERETIEDIRRQEKRSSRAVTFDRFMEFDEISAYLDEVIAANPSFASLTMIALSSEGRMVHGIKLSNGPGKKAIWLDCAIHAREWIAPPVCLKVIEEVVKSSELRDLADWYVLPVANPDGYAYSWSNSRFWRKTRSINAGSNCVGVDPNRNFDFEWNADGNSNPCSETYPGTRAFSEPETDGMAALVRSLGQSGAGVLYLGVHSYAQEMYYPYGVRAAPAPNAAEMQETGDIGAAAIEAVSGTKYDVYSESNPFNFIYGATDDYSYDVGKFRMAYTVELPGGGSGFDPPPSAIIPVVTETWAGIEAMARHVISLTDKQE